MVAPEAPSPTLHVEARVERTAHGFALDVRFDAPPGVTVLFGPSGSGKSTTLGAIAGLVKPKAGRIALGGAVRFDRAAGVDVAVHRRRLAYVFQSLALFPHMTAAQNVGYGMARDLSRDARRAQAVTLLTRLGVHHLTDRRPATFSGGEAQRVALARALATSPRVVLLDEPFSALDRDLRRQLVADLGAFIRELGVPVLFVTHHPSRKARALGDRVLLFDRGKIQSTCTPMDLMTDVRDATFEETPLDPDRALERDE